MIDPTIDAGSPAPQSTSPSTPPPPPGYSASDIVPSAATGATSTPPPPPGYSASDVVSTATANPPSAGALQSNDGSFLHNLNQGIGKGLDETFSTIEQGMHKVPGLGSIMDATGGSAQLAHDKRVATQPVHGVGGAIGYTGENVGEFLLGDEALKGLSLGDRLLKTSKALKLIEGSPRLAKAVEIGMNAMRAGTVQGAISTVKSDGDIEHGLGQGALAAGTVGALSSAAPLYRAIKPAFSLQAVQDALEGSHADIQKALETGTQAIQDDWHQGVRDIFDRVANDAGVTPEPAESLHDVASNVSDAIKAKAQGLYKQADAAVGGTRFQSFQDAVKNIRNAIREEVGLDPERDAQLQQRLADAQAGHEAAKETLAAKGIDPNIIDTADSLWRQGSALSDLSKPIQASISGLRADLQGAGAAESLSPAKLAARVNKMYDSGRLQQALGEGGSSDLLTAIEDTKQRLKDVANGAKQQAQAAVARAEQSKSAVKLKRVIAGATAGSALGGMPGFALLKHLLGQ